jgi:hypothetical protein
MSPAPFVVKTPRAIDAPHTLVSVSICVLCGSYSLLPLCFPAAVPSIALFDTRRYESESTDGTELEH